MHSAHVFIYSNNKPQSCSPFMKLIWKEDNIEQYNVLRTLLWYTNTVPVHYPLFQHTTTVPGHYPLFQFSITVPILYPFSSKQPLFPRTTLSLTLFQNSKFIHSFIADIYIALLQVGLLRSAPSPSAAK